MPREKVVRLIDYERRSRDADGQASERGQCEADVIVMPLKPSRPEFEDWGSLRPESLA